MHAGKLDVLGDGVALDFSVTGYGVNFHFLRTLQELGERFGLTRERIRQLERNALKKLERAMYRKKGISYEIGSGMIADRDRHQREHARMRREA